MNKNEVTCPEKSSPSSFGYISFGSSFWIQSLGYGRRIWNVDKTRAQDFNFNARLLLLSIKNDYVAPNFKYKYLKRSVTNENKYFGVGVELGAVFRWSRGYQVAYPNIELIWGKERENLRFTQFSINLLPASFAAFGIGHCAINGCPGDAGFVLLFAVMAIPAIFEYTIGF